MAPPDPERAVQLLDAAAELFNLRGYQATTIEDIGRAVGMTGPALYRYFRGGKGELLATLFDGTMETFIAQARLVEAAEPAGSAALGQLVDMHVQQVFSSRPRIRILLREVHNLPDDARGRFRTAQRVYSECWGAMVRAARPDLAEIEVGTLVQGVIALVNEYARRHHALADDAVKALVRSMSLSVLGVSFTTSAATSPPGGELPPAR